MQSCPHETSVLLKYINVKSPGASIIEDNSECIEELLILLCHKDKDIVNQSVPDTFIYPSALSYCCVKNYYPVKNNLLSFLHQFLVWFNNKGHKSTLFSVLICYVSTIERNKFIALLYIKFLTLQIFNCNLIKVCLCNVIYHLISFWWFHQILCINLFKNLKEHRIFKIDNIAHLDYNLYGCHTNSVMEVDETSDVIKDKLKSHITKAETLSICYEYGKNENEYSTSVKSNHNMREIDSNNLKLGCIEDKDIKEEVETNNTAGPVANGNLNCLSSDKFDGKNFKITSATCDATESNKIESCIKVEDTINHGEFNGTDLMSPCAIKTENCQLKSEPLEKALKDEKNWNACDCKSSEINTERDKTKSKEHRISNSISSHTSTRKDEHSTSHHSSSTSSRSKSKYYKSSSHQSSSSSKNSHERSKSNDQDKSKHEASDKRKSRNCHHKSDEKCHCKSRHHSRHHSKKSKRYQSVKTQCSSDEIAYELRNSKMEISNPYFTRVPWVPHPQICGLKYGRYYRIEIDRNGGASVVHLYMDEIAHLNEAQMKECAVEFIKLSYSEDENECAYHVMGIVHGAAAYLPDLVDYMADHYPTLTVKTGSLASRDNHTTTMSQYRDEVYKTYSNGTFRYAPLDQLSICGVLGEEVGAYFPDFVARLEQSPFMKPVMPWSTLSVVETDNPRESNDGPIFWVRPGEQMLPANEALKESARPKKRRNNELDNLAYIAGSRSSEARESLFMDRTKAHADQVGVDYGLSNTAPTAAVGVLKSVNCGHPEHGNRATKDVVAFHAQDYNELLEILMLDLYEPPQTQCTKWIEVSKLNTLRREGIRYAHVQLHDNDVYYLPRKIIHQFQTISSVASVAWHIRYKDYFSIMGAPNLHTPTGINKGQVFYEKKNVAVYYPPVSENELLASVSNPGSPLSKTPKKYEKLKDYSPFKHTPRKNQKFYSPRSNSKKEKVSDSVPHTPNKKESDSVVVHQEKNINGPDKKEPLKSENGKDASDNSAKKERDHHSGKKTHKSESSGHSQSSDHLSTKKERKESTDADLTHRKEVKNLDMDFELQKSKSKSTKSPSKNRTEKSGHDRNRIDEKSESSVKHKKHEGIKSKSHEKHEKSSHKRYENACSLSSNFVSENSGKNEENSDKSSVLKRKNGDSQIYCSSNKKLKEEIVEVAVSGNVDRESNKHEDKAVNECNVNSVNASFNAYSSSSVHDIEHNVYNADDVNLVFNKSSESRSSEVTTGDNKTVGVNCETNETGNGQQICKQQSDILKIGYDGETNDLSIPNISYSHGNLDCVVPHVNPPLPSTSPPSNPPLPPNSPLYEILTTSSCPSDIKDVNHREIGDSTSLPLSSTNTNCNSNEIISANANCRDPEHSVRVSKEKPAEALQLKKLKKKVVKKSKEESESYDLLGDIMSQMDKKK